MTDLTTTPRPRSYPGINWIGDSDGDGAVDAAFVQSGTGTLFIVR